MLGAHGPIVMNAIETIDVNEATTAADHEFQFPHGLMGFESVKRFVVIEREEEAPFLWLQMVDEPGYSFLLMPPYPYFEEYSPDVEDKDLKMLQVEHPEDLMLLNIVTMHGDGTATANLKGPVLLNVKKRLGAQFVLANAAQFSVQQPLPSISSETNEPSMT